MTSSELVTTTVANATSPNATTSGWSTAASTWTTTNLTTAAPSCDEQVAQARLWLLLFAGVVPAAVQLLAAALLALFTWRVLALRNKIDKIKGATVWLSRVACRVSIAKSARAKLGSGAPPRFVSSPGGGGSTGGDGGSARGATGGAQANDEAGYDDLGASDSSI